MKLIVHNASGTQTKNAAQLSSCKIKAYLWEVVLLCVRGDHFTPVHVGDLACLEDKVADEVQPTQCLEGGETLCGHHLRVEL